MPGNTNALKILSHLSLTIATWGRYCYYSFTNELDFVTKNISRLKELRPAFFLIFNVTLLISNFRFCKNLEFHENEWLTPNSPTLGALMLDWALLLIILIIFLLLAFDWLYGVQIDHGL